MPKKKECHICDVVLEDSSYNFEFEANRPLCKTCYLEELEYYDGPEDLALTSTKKAFADLREECLAMDEILLKKETKIKELYQQIRELKAKGAGNEQGI